MSVLSIPGHHVVANNVEYFVIHSSEKSYVIIRTDCMKMLHYALLKIEREVAMPLTDREVKIAKNDVLRPFEQYFRGEHV